MTNTPGKKLQKDPEIVEKAACRRFFHWFNHEHYYSANRILKPQRLPKAVWINAPNREAEKKNEAPAVYCVKAPEETSLMHPRSGYPWVVASPQSDLAFHRT